MHEGRPVILVQVFDEHGALASLEMFASENGANFYGLPLNEGKLRLTKKISRVPAALLPQDVSPTGYDMKNSLVPFWAGKEIQWEVTEVIHAQRENAPTG